MEKLIRPKTLANKLGISISSLYEYIKEPDFPNRIHLSQRCVAFKESEIEDWIEKRTEKKEAARPTEK